MLISSQSLLHIKISAIGWRADRSLSLLLGLCRGFEVKFGEQGLNCVKPFCVGKLEMGLSKGESGSCSIDNWDLVSLIACWLQVFGSIKRAAVCLLSR